MSCKKCQYMIDDLRLKSKQTKYPPLHNAEQISFLEYYKKAGAGTLKESSVMDCCWTIDLLRFVPQFDFINCISLFYISLGMDNSG